MNWRQGVRKVVLLIQGADFLRTGLNNLEIRYINYAFSWQGCVRTLRSLYVYATGSGRTHLSAFDAKRKQQILIVLRILQIGEPSSKRDQSTTPATSPPVIIHRICVNLRNNLKLGWTSPPQSTPCTAKPSYPVSAVFFLNSDQPQTVHY